VYWAFDSPRSRAQGAFPPEPLGLAYGSAEPGSERLRDTDLQRAWAVSGRDVRPADCGPVRLLSRFGHVVRTPGRFVVAREDPPLRWRDFADGSSAYGRVRVSGDAWHGTESGFVASWIPGSEFVKISTGVLVLFPCDHLLYQGPLPNRALVTDQDVAPPQLEVMAGLEYCVQERSRMIDGVRHGMAALNIIARASAVEVPRGHVIGWFHLVGAHTVQQLDPYPGARSADA
jgi:hypothetical protein